MPITTRSRWMPVVTLGCGAIVGGAIWIGGDGRGALHAVAVFVGSPS